MKYTFETEDEKEAQTLINAQKSEWALQVILDKMRRYIKDTDMSEEQYITAQEMQQIVINVMTENNLPFE